MTRFIMPAILIGIAITAFFMFTDPFYNDISKLRTDVASYNTALNNSKTLEDERDKLTAKFNAFDKGDLNKLEKLLPSSVDNIRLILEIEKIASPYGMALKDVKYNTTDTNSVASAGTALSGVGLTKSAPKDYGVFDLEFSTSGSYSNFINFTKNLEDNLRIVDISSISFSSDTSPGLNAKATPSDIYKYNFKIKTYWLKN